MSDSDPGSITKPADNRDINRVFWHSRRGMLELDLLLVPFAREVYPSLDSEKQAEHRRLLACEDTELFAWLLKRGTPSDPKLSESIQRVLEHSRAL